MANELVPYNEMCQAIARAVQVDRVLDIRDKAAAMEHYLRAANNFDAERQAAIIRLRAERRIGQMLQGTNKQKGKPDAPLAGILQREGITSQDSSRWQTIALIPEPKFEEYLADPKKGVLPATQRAESGIPTTKGLVTLGKAYKPRKPEKPEKRLTAEELAAVEEKKRIAAEKEKEKRTKAAFARTEYSSQRLLERIFLLYRLTTSKERAAFAKLVRERANELIEDPLENWETEAA